MNEKEHNKRKKKKEAYQERVKNTLMCIRSDRIWVPLASAIHYRSAAKKTLKYARRNDKPKSVIKAVKQEIKVASLIISELKLKQNNNDLDYIEKLLLKRR